ncbi:MAG TPA: hypothetical protein VM901_12510 [Bdellovibrionota bacterium]|nr:hypothetical protein [Bdellovibrionota bacterium]
MSLFAFAGAARAEHIYCRVETSITSNELDKHGYPRILRDKTLIHYEGENRSRHYYRFGDEGEIIPASDEEYRLASASKDEARQRRYFYLVLARLPYFELHHPDLRITVLTPDGLTTETLSSRMDETSYLSLKLHHNNRDVLGGGKGRSANIDIECD